MFVTGRGRIAGKRQLREWAAEMNAELARAFPTLCDNQMAGVLEIKRSPRGGEGVFVRAGHTVPRRTVLGYYPGEIGPQKERDGVHQKYVLGLPEVKVEMRLRTTMCAEKTEGQCGCSGTNWGQGSRR